MKTQTQLHKGVLIAALAKEASKGIESPGQAEKCHGQQQLPHLQPFGGAGAST